jgi:hypothetical protein
MSDHAILGCVPVDDAARSQARGAPGLPGGVARRRHGPGVTYDGDLKLRRWARLMPIGVLLLLLGSGFLFVVSVSNA